VTVSAPGPEPVPLPGWCTLVRADNPGPMTLDGTNTYVLRLDGGSGGGHGDGDGGDGAGGGRVLVVDPGPRDEQHLRRVAGHGEVALTLLTHGHPDHAEGARRFHELTGAPVRALDPAHCVATDEPLVAGPVERDGAGAQGLAAGPAGTQGLAVEVLFTPGHTADSVCFVVESAGRRAVLTGDTVLGRGTTVVAHPDGSLAPYLDSLRRVAALGRVILLPGHGPVRPDAAALAGEYLTHREARLAQVRRAVADGATTAPDVVRVVYADVDEALWPAAELSVRAQLDYLAAERLPG
jgi:glyoxylase-like metal-dependent hydrolase (beta-lactamase superfamily II)